MKCNTDMVTKAASIRVAGQKLKKGVLANADIDVKTRLSVVATHVFRLASMGPDRGRAFQRQSSRFIIEPSWTLTVSWMGVRGCRRRQR